MSERASQRALRSATNNDMAVPRSRLKFGERAFSIAAPRAWNSIPADLCATLNAATFKKNPKTFFYFVNLIRRLYLTRLIFAVLHCPFLFLVYVFLWSGWSAFAVSPSRLSLSLLSLSLPMSAQLMLCQSLVFISFFLKSLFAKWSVRQHSLRCKQTTILQKHIRYKRNRSLLLAITLTASAQPYPIQATFADVWCLPITMASLRLLCRLLSRSLWPLRWYSTAFILERWLCRPENPSSTSGEVILCGRSTRVEFTAISHPNTRIKRFI